MPVAIAIPVGERFPSSYYSYALSSWVHADDDTCAVVLFLNVHYMSQALSGTKTAPHVMYLSLFRVWIILQASIMSETQHPVPSPETIPNMACQVIWRQGNVKRKAFFAKMHRGTWTGECVGHIFRQDPP